jgi:hypothetical protein
MISATKEAVDSLIAALESGHSEVLTAYLGAMAKFHSYSFGTVMFIARQKPDATNVAGLRTWNSLGRFVKRGEKGIFILAPMIGKSATNTKPWNSGGPNGRLHPIWDFASEHITGRPNPELGIALHSPRSLLETGLRNCLPEKTRRRDCI